MFEKTFSSGSALFNGALVSIVLALFALTGTPGEAIAAAAATSEKIIIDASYLGNPESWQAGSVILQIADPAMLKATAGDDVKFLGTNRCFSAIPTGQDGSKVALPPGFYESQGESPRDIYIRIVNQDSAIFLSAVRGPRITDARVADFNCYLLIFAYKTKPVK